MKAALLLTAYNRPQYLRETLESWSKVRNFKHWPLHVQLEPSDKQDEMIEILRQIDHPRLFITVNNSLQGVLKNPWTGFDRLFRAKRYDFVVRMEDDIVVSTDILEYFEWAMTHFKEDEKVLLVQAESGEYGDENLVELSTGFSPYVWGTWQDRWVNKIGPTWDLDYSTYNGYPGRQSGWDWNLNTRLIPKWGMKLVKPIASRALHIGLQGTHASETELSSNSYKAERSSTSYLLS